MKLSEAAIRAIDLARKVRAYYDAELPRRHPNYPLVGPDDGSVPPPPEETELQTFLTGLPDVLIYQLILVMHLGRGDIGTENLAEYYEALRGVSGGPTVLASQLLNQAPLADYLADGLEELRKHEIPPDRLPVKKAKVPKR